MDEIFTCMLYYIGFLNVYFQQVLLWHQPNVATDTDGHLVVMCKSTPVLKYLGVMGHQVNNSIVQEEKQFFVLYVHFLCKFDFFNRRKESLL